MDIITKENKDAAVLRWLQLAIATDKNRGNFTRPILSGIHVDGDIVETADGFKIFQAPRPNPLSGIEDGSVVRVNDGNRLHKTAGRIYEGALVEGNFPDTGTMFPTSEPIAAFALNRRYLADVAQMPTESPHILTFTVYSHSQPILIESADGYRALCMPMRLDPDRYPTVTEHARNADAFPLLQQACKDALQYLTENDDTPTDLINDLHYALSKT